MFGLDPTVVNIRHSRLIYGVGVLNHFNPEKHPRSKKVSKDGVDWCTDVFDRFVNMDQPIALGDTVIRSYTPARPGQKLSLINIYCSEKENITFITDPGVRKCGTLSLDLTDVEYTDIPQQREIQIQMHFGETEIRVSAVDMTTSREVLANIDFLNR